MIHQRPGSSILSQCFPLRASRGAARPSEASSAQRLGERREEFRQRHTEASGNLDQCADVDVSLPTFDVPYGVAVKAGTFGKHFLRDGHPLSQLANAAPNSRGSVTRHKPYLIGCTTGCLHNVLCMWLEADTLRYCGDTGLDTSLRGMWFRQYVNCVREARNGDIFL